MFARIFFSLIFAALATAVPPELSAREIAGQTQPAFTEAVEAWLNGRDLEALKSLSALAKDGNVAAQILLASIASRAQLHSHVTSGLSREDRISLLRIPQGLSGKSWLTEAQKSEPLATALLQSAKIGQKAPAIAALFEYGEPTSALLAAQSMLFQGNATELLEVLEGLDGKLPEEASVLLLWALHQRENSETARYSGSPHIGTSVLSEEAFRKFELAFHPASRQSLIEDPVLRVRVFALSGDVTSWTPIKNFCEANCPLSLRSCTAVAASASTAGPFFMRSPAESLIPNDVYWSSIRVEADLARQIYDEQSWRHTNEFTQLNPCFFESMQGAQAKHGSAN